MVCVPVYDACGMCDVCVSLCVSMVQLCLSTGDPRAPLDVSSLLLPCVRPTLAHRHVRQATWSAGFVCFCFPASHLILVLRSGTPVVLASSREPNSGPCAWVASISLVRHFTFSGICQCSQFRDEAEKRLKLHKMKVLEIVPLSPPKFPKSLGLFSVTSVLHDLLFPGKIPSNVFSQ